MKKIRIGMLLVASVLAMSACSQSATVDDSTVSSIAEEGQDMFVQVQGELDDIQTAITASQASAELQTDFDNMRTEIVAALGTIGEDGMISAPDLSDELDSFQTSLDDLGDDVTPELQSAWDSLRTSIEQMMGS